MGADPIAHKAGAASPAGNRRLIASTGVLLHALLWIQVGSALIFALMAFNLPLPPGPWHSVVRPVHFFVGFLLVPLIAIKVASTSYRFLRYYTRNAAYHAVGAPALLARLTGPLMILSISVVLVSGIEMWSFANQFDIPWIPVHVISAIVFTVTLIIHVALHVREAHTEAAADLAAAPATADPADTRWRQSVTSRRAVLGAGVGAGIVLAVSTSQWPASALSWLSPRRAGNADLDFPIMNFEGGMQHVDTARWRLAVDGEDGLVRTPLSLSYADLLAMPMAEHSYSIDCVTGWTAVRRWRGVPLAHVLEQAGANPDFGHALIRSTSGYHWSHHRANCLLEGSLIVTHVNDTQLNDDHGFPARLMIPGVVGQSNVKWVDGIVLRRGAPDLYVAPNLTFDNTLPVSGKLLPPNPAGQR